ncbi:hypothetical protein MTR67_005266 [Solanum verrucosum]|uniref:RING-type E3 ubiquitin transferase n=1 Tax=Solanum verrucosum TaxID=315347 RepID=A0AAF0PVZ0_SOLVR|nr:probable E3 ubiquitin-protein ligase ZFP1 [Solanum verrucosum]WMV11881.1 hypothetical protein MTR67_005266 [Solanum verrucosum]
MNSNLHNFWQFTPDYPPYYQPPPNYYDPYLSDFYATMMNYHMECYYYYYDYFCYNYYLSTSGLVDESESDYDSDYLRDLFGDVVESDDYEDEEEVTEEIIGNMMKTRIHCGGSDDGEEIICVICQCEYENDETIGTLECQHEYHSSCIKEWLLKGKRSCPICRSSVLPL